VHERGLFRPSGAGWWGGRDPRAAPRVPRGWPWATACRPCGARKCDDGLSQGGSYRGRRSEGPMQKHDVVVRASRPPVWDRRPRRSEVRGRCGRGRYPGPPVWDRRPRRSEVRGRCGRGRYPGPHLGHPRLGHNSPIQRQRRSGGRLPLPVGGVIRPRQGHGAPGSAERQLGILLPSAAFGAPEALCRSRWRSGGPVPQPLALRRSHVSGLQPSFCFESHYLALQARLVCYAPSALRRLSAAAVGARKDACRCPLAGLSDHGKDMAPLGAPSASSAFFCRLPPSALPRPCASAVGAPEAVVSCAIPACARACPLRRFCRSCPFRLRASLFPARLPRGRRYG